ncbi:S26 family signal peptidase [Streptomyces laurentii]|uniref:S26 family signal peptidase n=1 Tax=Streptomyces laurentii TaxID=39478 RepID=UPI00367E2B40
MHQGPPGRHDHGSQARTLLGLGAALAGAELLTALTPHAARYLRSELDRAVGLLAQDRLFAAVQGFTGLGRFEDPRFLDRLRLAQQAGCMSLNQSVDGILGTARAAVTITGFLGSMLVLSPVMTGLALAAGAAWPAAGALGAGGQPASVLAVAVLAAVLTLALAGIVLLGRRLVVVTVRGESMRPAHRDGDRLLVRRGPGRPRRGDVVVLVPPGARHSRHWIVKRVAAAPGDRVPRGDVPALTAVPEARVPPGHLVLLGDNPPASIDSRQVGYFPADTLLGVVLRPLT